MSTTTTPAYQQARIIPASRPHPVPILLNGHWYYRPAAAAAGPQPLPRRHSARHRRFLAKQASSSALDALRRI